MSSAVRCLLPFALCIAGCSEREPPALAPSSRVLVVATTTPETRPPVIATPTQQRDNASPVATARLTNASRPVEQVPQELGRASPPAPELPVAPTIALVDSAGQPLPQTADVPKFDSPTFKRRSALLFQAIVDDTKESADAAFFPVLAYEQVKAIAKPARDHKFRLLAAYHRSIHEYHEKVAKLPQPLQFLDVEPGPSPIRWMEPNTEGNKLGYHRILRTKLKFADAKGVVHRLEVTSLISWRGEWYVVHLDGFK